MSTGTVTLHSWADGADDDDADPPMGSNYNARLDPKEDFDAAAGTTRRRVGAGGGLRSHAVLGRQRGAGATADGANVGRDEEGGW